MQIQVLICSHNEAVHLPRTLASLQAQTTGPDGFSVILVDNASNDDTQAVVKANTGTLNLQYVREERLGANYARNTALAAAQAPYVAFLDADSEAHPNWIAEISRIIVTGGPDLFGGPYFPYFITEKPAWFLDRYNSNNMGDTPRALGENEFLSGTNMVWRRAFIEQLGGFKVDVGLAGRGLVRGDETELIIRARRIQPELQILYYPTLIVRHVTRPITFSLWYWTRRQFLQGSRYRRIMPDDAQATPRGLQSLWLFAKQVVSLIISLLLRMPLRDRQKYARYQNYYYEVLLPQIWQLGLYLSLVRPRRQTPSR